MPAAIAQSVGSDVMRPNITSGKWRFVGPNNLVSADRLYTGPGSVTGTYYAATASGGVFRTTDSGATYTALSDTWPTHDQKIYLGTNLGAIWTNITHNFLNGLSGDPTYNWSQAGYDAHIECGSRLLGATPTDVLYVGLLDIEQSRDRGNIWVSLGGPVWTANALLHTDQHCLTLNPNGSGEALIGNDGGMYRLTDNLTSNVFSYAALNSIGAATQFYHLAAHPTNANYLLGGAQDNATAALINNSAAWPDVVGDGGFCAILNTNTQFASAEYLYLERTSNAWASSTYISPNTAGDNVNFIAPIVLDPTGTYLYAGTNYLYRYTIATGNWENQLGGTAQGDALQTIALAPSDRNQIYTGATDGTAYWSNNAGLSWTQINGSASPLPTRSITSISVSPTVSTSVLVGLSGTGTAHLWLCSNVAAFDPAWTSVSGAGASALPDISLNAIARDPIDPAKTWYVATDMGVFGTTNAGATWTNMTAPLGLPNVQTNDIVAVAGTGTLYAGTYGRSIWAISLIQQVQRVISGNIYLEGVPNPAAVSPFAPIGPLTVEFRTVGGGPIYTRTVTLPSSGAFSFSDIPAGNYTVAVKALKWLRAIAPANATSANVTGISLTLLAGDANNDIRVDSSDFAVMIGSYNTAGAVAGSGYDPTADFNFDGVVDSSDFSLLIGAYNDIGPN